MTFMYSWKIIFCSETPATMIQIICRSIRAVRKDPTMIAVSFMEEAVPLFGRVSVNNKAMAAKKPKFSAVNIFLNIGGHDRTSDVPGADIAG